MKSRQQHWPFIVVVLSIVFKIEKSH